MSFVVFSVSRLSPASLFAFLLFHLLSHVVLLISFPIYSPCAFCPALVHSLMFDQAVISAFLWLSFVFCVLVLLLFCPLMGVWFSSPVGWIWDYLFCYLAQFCLWVNLYSSPHFLRSGFVHKSWCVSWTFLIQKRGAKLIRTPLHHLSMIQRCLTPSWPWHFVSSSVSSAAVLSGQLHHVHSCLKVKGKL